MLLRQSEAQSLYVNVCVTPECTWLCMRLCPCVIVMGRPEPTGLKASLGDCPPTLWTEKGRKLLHAARAFQRTALGLRSQAHPQTPRHGSPGKTAKSRRCRSRQPKAESASVGADVSLQKGTQVPVKKTAPEAPGNTQPGLRRATLPSPDAHRYT